MSKDRRRQVAKQALNTGNGFPGIEGDPYWLTNMHGRFRTADTFDMADRLEEDAELLRQVAQRVQSGEILPEEGALIIAENANYGDYSTDGHLYDAIPIDVEEVDG